MEEGQIYEDAPLSVYAQSLGVYLTLSCLQQPTYWPKNGPIMLCFTTASHGHTDWEELLSKPVPG